MPNNSSSFPFEAVLWDMDGTLIDSEPIWMEQERRLMESIGAQWSEEDARYCLGGPMTRVDEYMRLRSGKKFLPGELTTKLLEMVGESFADSIPFAPGAKELLEELQSLAIPMALVSASPRKLMAQAMRSIGEGRFASVISNDDVTSPKPNPEGYLLAAKQLGVSIARSLIIEDSIPGMGAAQSSGAFVLGVAHFSELPEGPRTIQRISLHGLSVALLSELFNPILAR